MSSLQNKKCNGQQTTREDAQAIAAHPDPDAPVWAIQEHFALSLGQMGRMWRSQLERRLKPVGISLMQWQTLHYLATQAEPVVQKRLARAVGVDDPVMVGLLDRLESAGLVSRRAAHHDRRAKTVHLCARASGVLKSCESIRHEMNAALLSGLAVTDLATCARVFEVIEARLWAQRSCTAGSDCGAASYGDAADLSGSQNLTGHEPQAMIDAEPRS